MFLAAAKVGGIMANNNYPADFIYENLMIQTNIIHSAYLNKVKSCYFWAVLVFIQNYPPADKRRVSTLSDLEPTNKAYSMAKIAGIITCQSYDRQHGTNFISVMPTNIYGQNDNFDLKTRTPCRL